MLPCVNPIWLPLSSASAINEMKTMEFDTQERQSAFVVFAYLANFFFVFEAIVGQFFFFLHLQNIFFVCHFLETNKQTNK